MPAHSVQRAVARLQSKMVRAARGFHDYNFRHYFVKHVKDDFQALKQLSMDDQKKFLAEEGPAKLREMQRMVIVNRMFPVSSFMFTAEDVRACRLSLATEMQPTPTSALFGEYFAVCQAFSDTPAARKTHLRYVQYVENMRSAFHSCTDFSTQSSTRRRGHVQSPFSEILDEHGITYGFKHADEESPDPPKDNPLWKFPSFQGSGQSTPTSTTSNCETPVARSFSYPLRTSTAGAQYELLQGQQSNTDFIKKFGVVWNALVDETADALVDTAASWVLQSSSGAPPASSMSSTTSSRCYYDARLGMCLLRWNSDKEVRNYVDALHMVINAPLSSFITPLAIGIKVLGVPMLGLSLAPVSAPWLHWSSQDLVWVAFCGLCASLRLLKPRRSADCAKVKAPQTEYGPCGTPSVVTNSSTVSTLRDDHVKNDSYRTAPSALITNSTSSGSASKPSNSASRLPAVASRDEPVTSAGSQSSACGGAPSPLVCFGADGRWYIIDARPMAAYQSYARLSPRIAWVPRRELYHGTGSCFDECCGPNEIILGTKLKGIVRQLVSGAEVPLLLSTLAHRHGVRYGAYVYAIVSLLQTEEEQLAESLEVARRRRSHDPNTLERQHRCACCLEGILGELIARVIKHMVFQEWNKLAHHNPTWVKHINALHIASRLVMQGELSKKVSAEGDTEWMKLGRPFMEVYSQILNGLFTVKTSGDASGLTGDGRSRSQSPDYSGEGVPLTHRPRIVSYPPFHKAAAFVDMQFRPAVVDELLATVYDNYVGCVYSEDELATEWSALKIPHPSTRKRDSSSCSNNCKVPKPSNPSRCAAQSDGPSRNAGADDTSSLSGSVLLDEEDSAIKRGFFPRIGERCAMWCIYCLDKMIGIPLAMRRERLEVNFMGMKAGVIKLFFPTSKSKHHPLQRLFWTCYPEIPPYFGDAQQALLYAARQHIIGAKVAATPMNSGHRLPDASAEPRSQIHYALMGKLIQLHAADISVGYQESAKEDTYHFLLSNGVVGSAEKTGQKQASWDAVDVEQHDARWARSAFKAWVDARLCFMKGQTDPLGALSAFRRFMQYLDASASDQQVATVIDVVFLRQEIGLLSQLARKITTPVTSSILEAALGKLKHATDYPAASLSKCSDEHSVNTCLPITGSSTFVSPRQPPSASDDRHHKRSFGSMSSPVVIPKLRARCCADLFLRLLYALTRNSRVTEGAVVSGGDKPKSLASVWWDQWQQWIAMTHEELHASSVPLTAAPPAPLLSVEDALQQAEQQGREAIATSELTDRFILGRELIGSAEEDEKRRILMICGAVLQHNVSRAVSPSPQPASFLSHNVQRLTGDDVSNDFSAQRRTHAIAHLPWTPSSAVTVESKSFSGQWNSGNKEGDTNTSRSSLVKEVTSSSLLSQTRSDRTTFRTADGSSQRPRQRQVTIQSAVDMHHVDTSKTRRQLSDLNRLRAQQHREDERSFMQEQQQQRYRLSPHGSVVKDDREGSSEFTSTSLTPKEYSCRHNAERAVTSPGRLQGSLTQPAPENTGARSDLTELATEVMYNFYVSKRLTPTFAKFSLRIHRAYLEWCFDAYVHSLSGECFSLRAAALRARECEARDKVHSAEAASSSEFVVLMEHHCYGVQLLQKHHEMVATCLSDLHDLVVKVSLYDTSKVNHHAVHTPSGRQGTSFQKNLRKEQVAVAAVPPYDVKKWMALSEPAGGIVASLDGKLTNHVEGTKGTDPLTTANEVHVDLSRSHDISRTPEKQSLPTAEATSGNAPASQGVSNDKDNAEATPSTEDGECAGDVAGVEQQSSSSGVLPGNLYAGIPSSAEERSKDGDVLSVFTCSPGNQTISRVESHTSHADSVPPSLSHVAPRAHSARIDRARTKTRPPYPPPNSPSRSLRSRHATFPDVHAARKPTATGESPAPLTATSRGIQHPDTGYVRTPHAARAAVHPYADPSPVVVAHSSPSSADNSCLTSPTHSLNAWRPRSRLLARAKPQKPASNTNSLLSKKTSLDQAFRSRQRQALERAMMEETHFATTAPASCDTGHQYNILHHGSLSFSPERSGPPRSAVGSATESPRYPSQSTALSRSRGSNRPHAGVSSATPHSYSRSPAAPDTHLVTGAFLPADPLLLALRRLTSAPWASQRPHPPAVRRQSRPSSRSVREERPRRPSTHSRRIYSSVRDAMLLEQSPYRSRDSQRITSPQTSGESRLTLVRRR